MRKSTSKKSLLVLIALLLMMAPLTSYGRAATTFDYSVSTSTSGGLLAFASAMSNKTESFMNLTVVLLQYRNGIWQDYKAYSAYVENTATCYCSNVASAPRGYYYCVEVTFSSSSLAGVGPFYSESFYW